MRTTLVLDDRLVRDAKKRAAELKTTLSEVVNQSLRDTLARPTRAARPFRLSTFGGSGRINLEPAKIKELLEDE